MKGKFNGKAKSYCVKEKMDLTDDYGMIMFDYVINYPIFIVGDKTIRDKNHIFLIIERSDFNSKIH